MILFKRIEFSLLLSLKDIYMLCIMCRLKSVSVRRYLRTNSEILY